MLCIVCVVGCRENKKEAKMDLPDFIALWDFNHPEETEKKFRDLLPEAKASGDVGYLAELLTQIARTYSLRDEFDTAHETLDEVEPLLSEKFPKARIRYLLERGRTFNSADKKTKARPLFLEAWNLGKTSVEDSLAIDAAHMMAIVEPPKEQMAWNLKALALAESSQDQKAKKWLGSLYNNIGWTHFDLKEYDKAMVVFEKAVEFRQAQSQLREIQIAKWSVGRTHRAIGDIASALKIQESLYKEIQESGKEKDGFVFEELAECYLELNRPEATSFFALAYEQLSKDKWFVENEPARIQRLKELGTK